MFQIAVLRVCLAALAALLAASALVGLRQIGRLLLRRLKPIALAALLPLAALLTDFAGEKNTNMPLRVIRPVASQAFSSCGAVTNSGWLAHGACDAWFRIPATNWWARTADGWLDGVTVFAWCEFRPDIRTTNAYPRPFPQKLSLAPMANWLLLAGNEDPQQLNPSTSQHSLFWHGVTGSNTLVMTWQNGLYARCATNLVSFQAELFNDGSVAYRYDGSPVATNDFVVPLELPFDRDGDGLENSVDPEPDVAGPDAHGTNAEWYNTVCSNVLAAVATSCAPPGAGGNPDPETGGTQLVASASSVDLTWREGVNSNAYYFVDVVAERGPAPIWFTGDRASRLGNPVVVALAGETNRVPLLIGIDYAVTSDTPFSVSFPVDYMYPVVETNEPCVARIHWPLEFTIAPDGTGYRASATPYDPGCEFQWAEPTRSASCGYTTSGGWIGFYCGGNGDCGCHGCSVSGCATLELASLEIPSVWCGCWYDYSGSDPGDETPQTNSPSVSVSFDKSVVFYEDAYTNAPGDVVGKRSTDTTLTVFASGGSTGGMLYISEQNIGKFSRKGGNTITFPYTAYIPPHGGASFAIEYTATEHSASENDITVTASIAAAEDSASVTAVRVSLTAIAGFPANASRHVYGICETVLCESWPSLPTSAWETIGTGYFSGSGNALYYTCPILAASNCLTVRRASCYYSPSISVIEPTGINAIMPNAIDFHFPKGTSGGAGMSLQLYVLPMSVSFSGIALEEVPSTIGTHTGYFADSFWQPDWYHLQEQGAGDWTNIQTGNFFMEDKVSLFRECAPPWQAGTITWHIPIGWNERNTTGNVQPLKELPVTYSQVFHITDDGTLDVSKLGHTVARSTNDVIILNGVQVK